MSTLTKEALKAEVIATLGDDYEPNEADIEMVSHIMEAENKDLERVIWCHIRLDSITKRLMHKGWFAFDEYYFADDDTALDFLKNRGIKNVAEMDINRNEYLHYQQWWTGEIPAYMSTLTKEALKAEVIATLGDDYEPNEADIKMVAHIMEAENKDLERVIWCHIRLDSITKRLMHKGWFAFDEYYFADDDTALDFLKNRGIKNVAEMDINRNEYLYYQQWWTGEIPA